MLTGFGEPISAAWHPREHTLAAGLADGTIRLWSVGGPAKDAAAAPADGRDAPRGEEGGTATLKPLQRLRPVPGVKTHFTALAFSPDGGELLYAGIDDVGRAGIVTLKDGKRRLEFTEHTNTVLDARWSPDGKLAVTAGGDNHETLIWDPADGKVMQKLLGAGRSVFAVGWRGDGRAIAWGNTNRDKPLEQTFLLDDLRFGGKPDKEYGRGVTRAGPWELRPVGLEAVDIYKGGAKYRTFGLKRPNRFYSMAMIAGDRAVIGTAFGLAVLDLETGRVVRRFRGYHDSVMAIGPTGDGKYFLTGSLDQTVALCDPGRDDPLVSFFAAGREWIAWTPQGYYACSPYGERLMGWQVNHGRERLASFHPAARFRSSLYQPGIIRHVLAEKSFEKALALASQDRAEPIRPVSVADVLPPAVVLVAPTGAAAAVKGASVEVRAKARSSGGHPITALRLLVDGRPYQGDKGVKKLTPPAEGEVEVAWAVDLLPGKHLLAAVAESAVSKGVSPALEVTRAGAPAGELPDLNVLAVGISAYPGPLALKYAHKDAIVLAKTLQARADGVFRKVQVRLLTDEKATRQEVLAGLDWLRKATRPTDVAVVFLAGHGARDAKGQFHFIPVDFDDRDLDGTAVAGDVLKKKLANLPGRAVVVLDACHSGAASRLKRALTDDLVRDLVSEDAGVVVLCSSQGAEFSLEGPKVEHGLYTLGLVEALGGRADFNADGYVYLHELDFYAYHRVRQLSDGAQNPTTGRPANLRSFPLGKLN